MKIVNNLPTALLLCLSTLIPNTATTNLPITQAIFKSTSNWHSIIHNLTSHANRGDAEEILQQFINIVEMLEKSDDAITDSCTFLQNFINTMNNQFGTSLTLSDALRITRESVYHFQIPYNQIDSYLLGLDLIDNNAYSAQLCSWNLASHKGSNVWSWLTVATVSVTAVVVCILFPQVAVDVIKDAFELGKIILNNKK